MESDRAWTADCGVAQPAITQNPTDIATEDYFIDSHDRLAKLHIRNKRLADTPAMQPARVVLYVHGSPEPSECSIDLKLAGRSWMESLALAGLDVFFVNLRGHGRSTRPAAMDLPAERNPPCLTSADAAADLASAVNHVLHRRHVDRLSIMAWSRGCIAAGVFAESFPENVDRLVLIAPAFPGPGATASLPKMPAYLVYDRSQALARWLGHLPAPARAAIVPEAWIEPWWQANMAADATGAAQTPQVYRGPHGWYQNPEEHRAHGRSFYYEPANITRPTLLVAGQYDIINPGERCRALHDALINAPVRHFFSVRNATHYPHRERCRRQVIARVARFLTET